MNISYHFETIPWNGEAEFGMEMSKTPASGPAQTSTFALVRAIPDDSDYRKHVPLNFRLDAKKIVGEVAQDLSSKGKSADFWVELSHAGLTAAEIFAETSTLVGALAIAGPLLGLVSTGLALGAGYREAGEKIAADWSATGFARGAVMGADRRPASQVKDYFGNDYFPPNPQFPRGRLIAMRNYKMGLLIGYAQGRRLSGNQRTIFWRDLGQRMGDQTYRGPTAQWQRRDWLDWYVSAAAVFRANHL
jgi:hypothetical protein